MITKELVKSEIDNVPEKHLEKLYEIIKDLERPISTTFNPSEESLMSKLRKISIEGPEDFAENIDAYLNGKKVL